MFKSKQTKKISVNVVNNLLESYLNVSDKKILPKKQKQKQNASIINKISKDNTSVKTMKSIQKKSKLKERKQRNREINKEMEINEKVERLSKLENQDEEITQAVLHDKLRKLKQLNGLDDELEELQKEVLNIKKSSISEFGVHEAALSNRERREKKMLTRMKRDDATVGLTPGLAMPGESDDESEEESSNEGDNDNLRNFKDDFDEYS